MKHYIRINIFVFSILFTNTLLAQVNNNGIFFQAIARDNFTNPAKERKLFIESSIIKGSETGTKVFTELYQTNTDAFGVFNITIGAGKWLSGTAKNLTTIDWANGPYFLNIKISITPTAAAVDWDYTNDWVDLGTTPFGTVPYALYSGSSVDVSSKLSIADTAKMLINYLKVEKLNSFLVDLSKKLNSSDTALMLLPYKNSIVSLSSVASIRDSALLKMNALLDLKLNTKDSSIVFVTPSQLAAKTYDTSSLNNRIKLKINIADSIFSYVTPTQLTAKTFDTSFLYNTTISSLNTSKFNLIDTSFLLQKKDTTTLSNRINLKLTSTDTSLMLSNRIRKDTSFLLQKKDTATLSYRIDLKLTTTDTSLMLSNRIRKDTSFLLQKRDTTSLSTRINSKIDTVNKSTNLSLTSDQNDIKFPTVKAVIDYVDGVATTITAGGASPATAIKYGLIKLSGDLSNTPDFPLITANAITSSKILDGTITTADLADASITDLKIATGINKSKVGLSNVTDNAQLYSLNALTNQIQSFAIGTLGTAPNFSSVTATHTLHIPMATTSLVTAGLISKSDYDKFDAKQNTISLTTTGSSGASTYSSTTGILNVPTYTLSGLGGQVQLNGTGLVKATGTSISYDNAIYLTGNQTISLSGDMIGSGTTSITTTVININGQKMATLSTGILKNTTATGVPSIAVAGTDYESPLLFSAPLSRTTNTISIPVATTSANGYLNSTDWNTFNNKQTLIIASNSTNKYWNGYKSFVSLTTDSVSEGITNKFYTDVRTRTAISFVAGTGAYSSTTGIISIPTNTNQLTNGAGYISTYTETDPIVKAINGMVKSNGTSILAATAGTDYIAPYTSQTANYILAAPNGTAGTPSFRALVNADLPLVDLTSKVTGTLPVANGGTGITSIGTGVASFLATPTSANLLAATTDETGTGALVFANTPTLITPVLGVATATSIDASLGDVKARRFTQTTTSAVTAATTTVIDFSVGNVFQVNMGTNISTLTINNAAVGTYLIKFIQDATGSRNIIFPTANWKWAGSYIPDLTNAANKTDIVTLIFDGTTYYATIIQNF